jgi:hypothetical protein
MTALSVYLGFTSGTTGHRVDMTYWAVVLVVGLVAASLSWRAARRSFR